MRYVSVYLAPEGDAFGAAEQKIAIADEITRKAIHHVNVLDDQTIVMLEEFQGDEEKLSEIYDTQPEVLEYDITRSADSLFLYVHFEATETVANLLRLPQEHEIIIDTPMEYTPEGSLRITIVGEQSEIQHVMGAVPEEVQIDVDKIGDYKPEQQRLFAQLTEQQQKTLQLAVDRGYFKVPRDTTCEDLAEELGVSPSAVSNQLRRIEAAILSSVTP